MDANSPVGWEDTPVVSGEAFTGKRKATRLAWQARCPDTVRKLTAAGRAQACAGFSASEQEAASCVPTEMDPAERYAAVHKYEKRLRSRGKFSTPSVPLQDALAEAVLSLYQEQPHLRAEDTLAYSLRNVKVSKTCDALSGARRDAAVARWDGTTEEERIAATRASRDAAREARRSRALQLLRELQQKEVDGSLSPAERLSVVRKYKGRVKRSSEPLCPELDAWAARILKEYASSPQSRVNDLLAVRRERILCAASSED